MTGVFLLSERITGKLLRIFIDEADRYEGKPLYMAIVEALKAAGFTGATVLKGIEGYGIHKTVHAARTFDLSTNLPILIEVIEQEAKITAFLPALRTMVSEGLITLENLELMRISRGDS
jgi:PII-like signaling protein